MLFYCYPPCSTCQKAQRFLEDNHVAYELRHIKNEVPSASDLRAWWEKSGLPLKRFFNTSGQKYAALALKDKLPTMTEDEQLALLATDGMLIKRPLFITEETVLVGFKEVAWRDALGLQAQD